jgi:hypothetical protein
VGTRDCAEAMPALRRLTPVREVACHFAKAPG